MSNKSNILRRPRSSKYNPVQFGVSVRKAGRRVLSTPIMRPISTGELFPQEVEQMGLIQGKKPGSMYEWRLARALETNGYEYDYQVSVAGGRAMRGGQVIDFLVHTVPMFTPLFADGEYWHTGQLAREDSYKRAFIDAEWSGIWNTWVSLFGPDLHSQEAANQAVRRLLR